MNDFVIIKEELSDEYIEIEMEEKSTQKDNKDIDEYICKYISAIGAEITLARIKNKINIATEIEKLKYENEHLRTFTDKLVEKVNEIESKLITEENIHIEEDISHRDQNAIATRTKRKQNLQNKVDHISESCYKTQPKKVDTSVNKHFIQEQTNPPSSFEPLINFTNNFNNDDILMNTNKNNNDVHPVADPTEKHHQFIYHKNDDVENKILNYYQNKYVINKASSESQDVDKNTTYRNFAVTQNVKLHSFKDTNQHLNSVKANSKIFNKNQNLNGNSMIGYRGNFSSDDQSNDIDVVKDLTAPIPTPPDSPNYLPVQPDNNYWSQSHVDQSKINKYHPMLSNVYQPVLIQKPNGEKIWAIPSNNPYSIINQRYKPY